MVRAFGFIRVIVVEASKFTAFIYNGLCISTFLQNQRNSSVYPYIKDHTPVGCSLIESGRLRA